MSATQWRWGRPGPLPRATSHATAGELVASQIELLTGQPSQTVRRFLRAAGIALRRPGGLSPFLRRWAKLR
jgi:hypothetical protein